MPAIQTVAASAAQVEAIDEHIIEIVSDSGEGAQTCGQIFGSICAKKGAGVWTVEIIPAEIEPPARSRAGASGNRIRIGSCRVTNAGDEANLVIAFNEQVLYSRIDAGAYREGAVIYLDDSWRNGEEGERAVRRGGGRLQGTRVLRDRDAD